VTRRVSGGRREIMREDMGGGRGGWKKPKDGAGGGKFCIKSPMWEAKMGTHKEKELRQKGGAREPTTWKAGDKRRGRKDI